jgi:hypothetical protein
MQLDVRYAIPAHTWVNPLEINDRRVMPCHIPGGTVHRSLKPFWSLYDIIFRRAIKSFPEATALPPGQCWSDLSDVMSLTRGHKDTKAKELDPARLPGADDPQHQALGYSGKTAEDSLFCWWLQSTQKKKKYPVASVNRQSHFTQATCFAYLVSGCLMSIDSVHHLNILLHPGVR